MLIRDRSLARRQLERELPGLTDALGPARAELRPAYEQYVAGVSAAEHAMSLELASLLLALCRRVEAERTIDLGSGFSSYVLRRYAADRPGTEVTSVDSSETWLEKSRAFVDEQGLAPETFVAWGDFDVEKQIDSYDVVLHDLGDMTLRAAALPRVLTLARSGGYIVLDDVHKRGYRSYARSFVAASSVWGVDTRAATRDAIGRYALMVRRY